MSKVKLKQQSRRAEIIVAATKLMDTASFAEISVNQICEAAGISIGTFYHYFQKKSDILAGLLLLADEDLAQNVLETLQPGQERENLMKVALGFSAYVQRAGMERTALSTSVALSDVGLDGEKRLMNRTVEAIFARGQADGSFTEAYSSEELASFFLVVMRGVVADWARRGNPYDLSRRMEDVVGLFLAGVCAGGQGPQKQ